MTRLGSDRGRARRPRASREVLRGLNTAASGNAQAFGFSITITATYGVLTRGEGNPTLPQILEFALSAVAAFALLNLAVAAVLGRRTPSRGPERVVLVATATDFLAVGLAITTAAGLSALLRGWPAWVLAPFAAALVYVLVQSLEMIAGLRQADRASRRGPDGAG